MMYVLDRWNVILMSLYCIGWYLTGNFVTSKLAAKAVPVKIEKPKEEPKEETRVDVLRREIKEMKVEAEQLNNPATFSKYAKINRQILKKENELEDEIKKVS